MKQILLLVILSTLSFVLFLIALVFGIIKKNEKLKWISLFLFFAFVILSGSTVFKVVNKSYHKVTEALKPRTGDEIYDSLFGTRQTKCVSVLNSQDQVVPKIDAAILLHFKTCPAELKRILAQHKFGVEKLSTSKWNQKVPYGENIKWFNPNKLGDTIMVYEYSSDNSRNIQTIWSNLDSTEVFVRDIFD